ncbi:MAG TPA: ATP phosphoribosyltransferase regulatory subunit, partial [Candidatus Accumulibacter sp.]|nr:ATP phosphoribosyltransferase regulatory subunit [Accumulibacter sp.]
TLAQTIAALRAQGAVVVELLPGESGSEGPPCDRRLVENDGQWLLENINRDGSV